MNKNFIDKQEFFSQEEVCNKFSISGATLKNWIRLEKISPFDKIKNKYYFKKDYIENFQKEVESGNNSLLKSRRNKKFVSGNGLYKAYLSPESSNAEQAKALFNIINSKNIKLSVTDINEILADCAIKLFKSRVWDNSFEKYRFLTDDISGSFNFIKSNPEIQNINFKYEKNEDILGLLYISLRDLNSRKSSGAYYTPYKIVKNTSSLFKTLGKDEKIIDPCCGTGNFLINLSDDVGVESIYGYDIDELAIKIVRINIALKYLISDKLFLYSHFRQADFLNDQNDQKFDVIIGNPPWGYNFSERERKTLSSKYISAKSKGFDSYEVFIEKAINALNKNGFLYFVLPESVLNVQKHEPIRKFILENTILNYLEFLGNIFDGVQCESIVLGLKKENGYFCSNYPLIVHKNRIYKIEAKARSGSQRTVTSKCFSFYSDDTEYVILLKIENLKNKTFLENQADFALGIVTGDNKKFLSKEKKSGYEPVVKGSGVTKFGLKTENYIKFEPQKFQQCAPEVCYRAPEKLLYKFIGGKLIFAYDNNKTLCLNSCNILIPHIKGLDIRYIQSILNSKVAQFYFDKTFNSVKILRSHLEKIPIPVIPKDKQSEIVAVEKLIEDSYFAGVNYSDLTDSLNRKIARLYELSDSEYNIILKS